MPRARVIGHFRPLLVLPLLGLLFARPASPAVRRARRTGKASLALKATRLTLNDKSDAYLSVFEMRALSNRGDVIGQWVSADGTTQGSFFGNATSGLTEMRAGFYALAVNDKGHVLGDTFETDLSHSTGVAIDTGASQLTVVSDSPTDGGTDLSSSDQVIGYRNAAITETYVAPFSWTLAHGLQLGPPELYCWDVNTAGQVLCRNTNADPAHPLIWQDMSGDGKWDADEITDLGTGPPSVSGAGVGAINAQGVVAATMEPISGGNHLIRWTSGPGWEDLGAPATEYGGAESINSQGQILGGRYLWSAGEWIDLQPLADAAVPAGIHLYEYSFQNLNDRGQFLAQGYSDSDSVPRLYLMQLGTASTTDVFDANSAFTQPLLLPLASPADNTSLTTLASDAWTATARKVTRAAADGVTLLLLRYKLKASDVGPMRLRLVPELDGEPTGSLWKVDDPGVTDYSTDGGMRDTQPEGPATLNVDPVSLNGDQYVFALYRSPRNFDPDPATLTSEFRERLVELRVQSASIDPPQPDTEDETDLTVVRPLLIFQHGTYDSKDGWNHFLLYEFSARETNHYTGGSEPFQTDRTDFHWVHGAAGHIWLNAGTVFAQLQSKLQAWRAATSTAGTQVDVVTHSYGGPTMRWVTQIQPDLPYTQLPAFRCVRNWGHGYFHKLITIGGSHRGAAIGNSLAYLNHFGKLKGTGRFLAWCGSHPIDQGAVEDQLVGSPAMALLRETRLPCHAIVGSGLCEYGARNEPVPFLSLWLFDTSQGAFGSEASPFIGPNYSSLLNYANLRKLSNFVFNYSYTDNSDGNLTPNYDLTVGSLSSKGGLSKPAYTDVFDLDPQGGLVGHITHVPEPTRQEISDRVKYLLMRPTTSPEFAHFQPIGSLTAAEAHLRDFGPAAWLYEGGSNQPQGPPGGTTAPILALRALALQPRDAAREPHRASTHPTLTSTAGNGEILAGASTTVTASWPGKTVQGGIVAWDGVTTLDGGVSYLDTGTHSSTVAVAADATPGPLPVTAIVVATDGTIDVATLALEVEDPTPLTALQINPSTLTFNSVDPQPLSIQGQHQDGSWVDLTQSHQVQVSSADPNVAAVTDARIVYPNGFGNTTVTASANGLTATCTVTVAGSAVSVAPVPASTHLVLKRTSTKAVNFAFLYTTGFDPAQIVPASVRINGVSPYPQRDGTLVKLVDVNHDHHADAEFGVRPVDLNLPAGSVTLHLVAATRDGRLVAGSVTATAR